MRHYSGLTYVVGCGGTGSWLAAKLHKLVGPYPMVLMDGDILEEKNLDRQFFNDADIGLNKAEALGAKYDVGAGGVEPIYFHSGVDIAFDCNDVIFCAADNHACRLEVLRTCDMHECRAVIMGNEYTDAEAYWYERSWADTPNDPRRFYPDILLDRSGDPLAPDGCTGHAQQAAPQLVLANDMSAALALQLFWFHCFERPELSPETEPHWPVLHRVNRYRTQTVKKGDRQ